MWIDEDEEVPQPYYNLLEASLVVLEMGSTFNQIFSVRRAVLFGFL